MAEGFEGGKFHPQAHQLIEELPPPGGQEAAVLPGLVTGLILLLRQELEIQHGVEGQGLPLPVQQQLEDNQVKLRAGAAPAGLGGKAAAGVHQAAYILVGKGPPALLRPLGAGPVQKGGAQLQNPGAAQPLPDGEQGLQPLGPLLGLHQLRHRLSAGDGPGGPKGQGLKNITVQLADGLVHAATSSPAPHLRGGKIYMKLP